MAPRLSSAWSPALEPLPMECYPMGAELIVFARGPRREVGRYMLLGEREAWRAADLLGAEFDVMILTRSSWSARDTLSAEDALALRAVLARMAPAAAEVLVWTPAEREARIRELKAILRGFGPALEAARVVSKNAVWRGKPDRKVKRFREYEEREFRYAHTKREFDRLSAELGELQNQARNYQNRRARSACA